MAKNNKSYKRFNKGAFWCLIVLLFALVLVSCSSDDDDTPSDRTISRTIIAYIVAENTLNNVLAADVYEMIQGAKSLTDNDCLLLYIDDIKTPRIYTIDNKTEATDLVSLVPEKQYDGDLNSCDPKTLAHVLDYARRNHSADSYGIVFWSHASGWQTIEKEKNAVNGRNQDEATMMPSRRYSFGIDNGLNKVSNVEFDPTKEELSIIDLASVVESFGKVDFIFFDCCFMQTVEVAYQLRNATKYIIGAPNEIPARGAPYDKIVPLMAADKIDYNAIVDAYYEYYCNGIYGSVLSVISTAGLPQLADATARVYAKYKNSLEDLDLSKTNNYFNYDVCRHNRDNCYPDFYDMNSVMLQWLSSDDYAVWKQAFDQAVAYSRSTDFFYSAFKGNNSRVDTTTVGCVSMFLPLQKYRGDYFLDSYFRLDWSKALGIYK
jgi:hypothetical protein